MKFFYFTLIFFLTSILSQDPWSYPTPCTHEIVSLITLNIPTVNGTTLVTALPRTFAIDLSNGTLLPKAMIGIAGLYFTPISTLKYVVTFITNITAITLKLQLTYPTTFNIIKICYFAQIGSSDYFFIVKTQISTDTASSVVCSTTNGTYLCKTRISDSSKFQLRLPLKCMPSILGFIGTSTTNLYQYSATCQPYLLSTDIQFDVAVTFYNNLTNLTIPVVRMDLIMLSKLYLQMLLKTKILYQGILQTSNGTILSIMPTFTPALTIGIFGLTYVKMKIGQLYQLDFNFNSNFVKIPQTDKNFFFIALLSTKTCSNPLQYLNRVNFQCISYTFYNCSPEYIQFNVGETVQIYETKISKSKRYVAICYSTKIVIYRFNSTTITYSRYQQIFISTDCKSIDVNQNFSILAVVGTNLFQVYTMNEDHYFQNFYTFPSSLGITYTNSKVSITSDGMKAVISASLSGTSGHYYFIYDKKTNEYIYKRFEATNAKQAFFSNDGQKLYVTTSNKLIVYKQKQLNIIGNYVIDYVIWIITNQTNTQGGFSAISKDNKVFAQYITYYGIKIFQYDQVLERYVYHSIIKEIYLGHQRVTMIRITENGLSIVAQATGHNLLHFYTRNNLIQQFTFQSTSDGNALNYSPGRQNGFAMSIDGKMITTIQSTINSTTIMRIYTCGISVVQMIQPPNGKDLIYSIAQQIDNLLNSNSTDNKIINDIYSLQKQVDSLKQIQKVVLGFIIVIIAIIGIVLVVKTQIFASQSSSLIKPQQNLQQHQSNLKNNKNNNDEDYLTQQNNLSKTNLKQQTILYIQPQGIII